MYGLVFYWESSSAKSACMSSPRASRSYYFTFKDDYYFRYTFVIAS